MSSAESSTPNGPRGPQVADDEELYRCITHRAWWCQEERRLSSAAFSWPVFSVDVASISGSPAATLSRFDPGTGLVSFECHLAKELGCDPRLEADPKHPDNKAHANVYTPEGSRRKRTAKRLAEICSQRILVVPSFPDVG